MFVNVNQQNILFFIIIIIIELNILWSIIVFWVFLKNFSLFVVSV